MTETLTARLAALEDRLRRLEDEQEIIGLIASYGPAVDAGLADEVAELWTDDGVYDVDELYLGSRSEVRAMVAGEDHQGLIARGVTHFLGPAHVTIDGDEATALCHSILVVHHQGRYLVVRSGANRWQLRRTPNGWRTVLRTTRTLDGSEASRALFAR